MAAPPYWIHINDPSFPDAPWPGQRRLGPFVSIDEAREQAYSDAAIGAGVNAVYDDAGSMALDAHLQGVVAAAQYDEYLAGLGQEEVTDDAFAAARAAAPKVPPAPKPAHSTAEVAKEGHARQRARADEDKAAAAAWAAAVQAAVPASVRELMAALQGGQAGSHPGGLRAPPVQLLPPGAVSQGA